MRFDELRLEWEGTLALLVRDRAKNGDGEVREKRCAFVKLQPAHDAVLFQILPDARFVDAEMIGELFLQVGAFAAAAPAAKQIPDTDAQCLAGFDVVVASLVRIGDEENTRASRCVFWLIHRVQRTGQQAAELRFEMRYARGKRRIARARAHVKRRTSYCWFETTDGFWFARPAFRKFFGNIGTDNGL